MKGHICLVLRHQTLEPQCGTVEAQVVGPGRKFTKKTRYKCIPAFGTKTYPVHAAIVSIIPRLDVLIAHGGSLEVATCRSKVADVTHWRVSGDAFPV